MSAEPRTSHAAPVLVVAGVLRRGDTWLMAKRRQGSIDGGAWEFPGGKVEPGEDPREGLVRELDEELGVAVEVGRPVEIAFERRVRGDVLLMFFDVKLVRGEPAPLDADELRWVRAAAELAPDRVLEADRGVLEHLCST